MSNHHHSFKSFVLGSMIGAAVGAAAALLYMPETGKKLRADIKKKAGKIKEKVDEAVKVSQNVADNCKEGWGKLGEIITECEGAVKSNDGKTPAPAQKASADNVPAAKKNYPPRAKKKIRFFRGI